MLIIINTNLSDYLDLVNLRLINYAKRLRHLLFINSLLKNY